MSSSFRGWTRPGPVPPGAAGPIDVPEGQTLVVCRVGSRSARARAYLARLGHDVVNLDGGMVDWFVAGRPIVSETGQDPQIV